MKASLYDKDTKFTMAHSYKNVLDLDAESEEDNDNEGIVKV